MSYTKRTLRRMHPVQRKLAKSCNGIELELKRLKRLVDELGDVELDARALRNQNGIRAADPMLTWPRCPECDSDDTRVEKGSPIQCGRCGWRSDEHVAVIAALVREDRV